MIKRVHKVVEFLNSSKYFTGIMMIMLNIGSKYITVKLSKSQEAYVRNYIIRELLIFSVCWMGTRDIYISLIITACFFVLTQHLFNEDSNFCILPEHHRKYHLEDDGEIISDQEINDAVATLTKAKQQKSERHKDTVHHYFKNYK